MEYLARALVVMALCATISFVFYRITSGSSLTVADIEAHGKACQATGKSPNIQQTLHLISFTCE